MVKLVGRVHRRGTLRKGVEAGSLAAAVPAGRGGGRGDRGGGRGGDGAPRVAAAAAPVPPSPTAPQLIVDPPTSVVSGNAKALFGASSALEAAADRAREEEASAAAGSEA